MSKDMKNIIRIFYEPVEVFNDIKEKPAWFIALIVLAVFSLIGTAVLIPGVIRPEVMKYLKRAVPPESLEQAIVAISGIRFYIMTLLRTLIGLLFIIVIQAGFFSIVLSIIGKEAGFKKLLSITVYSYLVTIAGIILKTPLSLIKQSAEIHTSLLLFLPFLKQETFFYNFFAQIDFFNIWAFILLSIGISVVSEFDRKKSYILVFVTWLLFAAGLATLATIGLKMGGLK